MKIVLDIERYNREALKKNCKSKTKMHRRILFSVISWGPTFDCFEN